MKVNFISSLFHILFLVVIYLGFIEPVHCYTFEPTEAEFNMWPYKCKAIYASTRIGQTKNFTRSIPVRDIRLWRHEADKNGGAWHYCAGLVHYLRGIREPDASKKEEHYLNAYKEISFSYVRLKNNSTWRPEIATALAQVERARGKREKALELLENVIQIAPDYSKAYVISALIYRDQKKLASAKDILIKGMSAVKDESAELYYVLGLVSLEQNEIKEARKYADKAYELGYPLPWLKNKLKEYP